MPGGKLLKEAPCALPELLGALREARLFFPKAKRRVSRPTAMEVFVMIRHKITISKEAKELSIMLELKHLMKGIIQWPPAQ